MYVDYMAIAFVDEAELRLIFSICYVTILGWINNMYDIDFRLFRTGYAMRMPYFIMENYVFVTCTHTRIFLFELHNTN